MAADGEEGETTGRGRKHTAFLWTVNNWTQAEQDRLIWAGKTNCGKNKYFKTLAWGREIGKKRGTPHLQGYAILRRPCHARSLTLKIRNIIGRAERPEDREVEGDKKKADVWTGYCYRPWTEDHYILKRETKEHEKDEDWYKQDVNIYGKGPNEDDDPGGFVNAMKLIGECDTLWEVNQHPGLQGYLARNKAWVMRKWHDWSIIKGQAANEEFPHELKPWQKEVLDIISGPSDSRTIHWFYGPGNIGKSSIADWILLHENASLVLDYWPDDMRDFMNIIAEYMPRVVVWDIPMAGEMKGRKTATYLEKCKRQGYMSTKYHGTKLWLDQPPHCIVFANTEAAYLKLSPDRLKLHYIE